MPVLNSVPSLNFVNTFPRKLRALAADTAGLELLTAVVLPLESCVRASACMKVSAVL